MSAPTTAVSYDVVSLALTLEPSAPGYDSVVKPPYGEVLLALDEECDRNFMDYLAAKSAFPGPEWAWITDPFRRAWQDSQTALFLLGCL